MKKAFAGTGKARQTLMARLEKEISARGTIDVLRKGFALTGCGAIDMSESAPEDQRNADVLRRYASNNPEEDDIVLTPVGPGGGDTTGKTPLYLQEIIEKLNGIFGEAAPIEDQAAFVNQIASNTHETAIVSAQIAENTKDQALNQPFAFRVACSGRCCMKGFGIARD